MLHPLLVANDSLHALTRQRRCRRLCRVEPCLAGVGHSTRSGGRRLAGRRGTTGRIPIAIARLRTNTHLLSSSSFILPFLLPVSSSFFL